MYLLILAMLGSIFFQMKYLNMAMIAFGSSQVMSLTATFCLVFAG
jgi:hypothetical protein